MALPYFSTSSHKRRDFLKKKIFENKTLVFIFYKFGKNLKKNQNSIAEEIKSGMRSGSACYHLVQNLLSSRLVSKNLKIKI